MSGPVRSPAYRSPLVPVQVRAGLGGRAAARPPVPETGEYGVGSRCRVLAVFDEGSDGVPLRIELSNDPAVGDVPPPQIPYYSRQSTDAPTGSPLAAVPAVGTISLPHRAHPPTVTATTRARKRLIALR